MAVTTRPPRSSGNRSARSPDLERYRHLKTYAAEATGGWLAWQQRALGLTREHLARQSDVRDRSLLVELLLDDGNDEAAWLEAKAGGCRAELWLRLAGRREHSHPADSLQIYQTHLGPTIAQGGPRAYKEAIALLTRISTLLEDMGRAAEYGLYERRSVPRTDRSVISSSCSTRRATEKPLPVRAFAGAAAYPFTSFDSLPFRHHAGLPLVQRRHIIYQAHVKAFADSNGDGIGDFGGLMTKLDYLQSLGVTAIWLLPFYPSPLRDDGYDIADYYNVNPQYGTLADFRAFLKEAHQRGLRVITELVINHTSDQNPWFQRARRAKKVRWSAISTSGATRRTSTRTPASSSRISSRPTGRGTRWPGSITGTVFFIISPTSTSRARRSRKPC